MCGGGFAPTTQKVWWVIDVIVCLLVVCCTIVLVCGLPSRKTGLLEEQDGAVVGVHKCTRPALVATPLRVVGYLMDIFHVVYKVICAQSCILASLLSTSRVSVKFSYCR